MNLILKCSAVLHFEFFSLIAIASNKVEDVRTVLEYYNGFDDPMAKFRENQAAVMVCRLFYSHLPLRLDTSIGFLYA